MTERPISLKPIVAGERRILPTLEAFQWFDGGVFRLLEYVSPWFFQTCVAGVSKPAASRAVAIIHWLCPSSSNLPMYRTASEVIGSGSRVRPPPGRSTIRYPYGDWPPAHRSVLRRCLCAPATRALIRLSSISAKIDASIRNTFASSFPNDDSRPMR